MKSLTLKRLCLGIATVGLVGLAQNAHAQTATVQADLVTNSAVTATTVSAMDFGEWLLQHGGGPTTGFLTLTDDGTVDVTATPGAGNAFVEITPSASEGLVNVQGPAVATLTVTRNNTTDFTDAGLSLSTVTFRTATDGQQTLATDGATGSVTLQAANTDEAVTFGGSISVSAPPADATHSATFDVSFSY